VRLERRYRVRHGYLPLSALVVHPQMRLTVDEEGIEQLAENIALHGLIHPLCVADREDGYTVISGHRRLQACLRLEERGHRVGEVAVIIFEHLTLVEMALLQASENIHEQVPPHEAAKFYEATWRLLKIHEPAFTILDFSRAVGRSEQTIRNALRFALLPDGVQQYVVSGMLPYGAAVHLTKLQEYCDDQCLEQWALRIVVSQTKVADVQKQVDTHLSDIRSGQLSMLDLFSTNAQATMAQEARRMRIDRSTIFAFWDGIRYLDRLLSLFQEGKLKKEDSPWLRHGPKSAFLKLIALEQRFLEHLGDVLLSEELEVSSQILETCENLLTQG